MKNKDSTLTRHVFAALGVFVLLLFVGQAVAAPGAGEGFGPDGNVPALPADPGDDEPLTDEPPATGDLAMDMTAKLMVHYTFKELEDGAYVGAEFCIACHPSTAAWKDTRHAQALRRPMAQYSLMAGKGVVADYDSNGVDDFMQGLDFNEISSVFDAYKPNAPILGYGGGQYTITIGDLVLPIVATQGGTGEWKQRYLVRVPVSGTADGYSAENYVSPLQYNEKTRGYVSYHPEQWWSPTTMLPLFDGGTSAQAIAELGRSYSKKCIGCHTTGIRALGQDGNGEWNYTPFPAVLFEADDPGYFDYDHDGIFDIVNISCEACHGPGSKHILGGGDPSQIVNPEHLDAAEANEVCGQCHSRVKSVPNGTHDWPFMDDTGTSFIPGQGMPLDDFFIDASGRWPDGINSRQHHQQWLDFLESPKPGFLYHPVKCIECHEPHGNTSNDRLIRDVLVEDGVEIATSVANNTLCLACHATHGPFADINPATVADLDEPANRDLVENVVEAHANHPYGAERGMGLDRCVECHMPKVAKSAVNYDIRSHVFEVISPEKTLMYQDQGGMPNSCAVSCHSLKVNSFGYGLDTDIGTWNRVFDRRTAQQLEKYFGPGGIWWDTSEETSSSFEALQNAAAPGEYQPPVELDEED